MDINRGDLVHLPDANGISVPYIVTAIRHYPVDYVELTNQSGQRTGMPLSQALRAQGFHARRGVQSVTQSLAQLKK